MTRTLLLVIALTPFFCLHCDNQPSKGKAVATVGDPTKPESVKGASQENTVSFPFSPATGSKVEFVGAKVTRKHNGSFGTFSGLIQVVGNAVEKSSVSVDIDTSSLSADDPKLTTHLKSPDFLDVAKFPKARFVSTSLRAGGEKGATHTITGNLELHGVTKSISFPATIHQSTDGVDVDAEFAINRKDFSIVYPGMPDDLIKDDVLIHLTVHAKKG